MENGKTRIKHKKRKVPWFKENGKKGFKIKL